MRTIDRLSDFWLVLYFVITIGAAIGATLFPTAYAALSRWWETPLGRYMMYKGVVLAVSLDFVVLRIFVRDLPLWVIFVILTLICVMVWWYTILFISSWMKARKKRKRREDRQPEES